MKLFLFLVLSFGLINHTYANIPVSDADYQALLNECELSYGDSETENKACKYGVSEYLENPSMELIGISEMCNEKYSEEKDKVACENGGVIVAFILFLVEIF